jgi:hypothetical protein
MEREQGELIAEILNKSTESMMKIQSKRQVALIRVFMIKIAANALV